MARQNGIIKLRGTIDGITFYKSQDGHLARAKGGVDRDRIATDPAFIRTRENGAEFTLAARSGKVIRDAVRPLMIGSADDRVTSRLTRLMTRVKYFDTTSVRGLRGIGVAIADPAAMQMINGFNFNNRSILGEVLFKPYQLTTATGLIRIPGLIPENDVAFPTGATHVSFNGAWVKINFATGGWELQQTNLVNLPINSVSSTVTLTPSTAPASTGTDLYLLHVSFYQMVNGVQYSLRNGAFNTLSIIGVN